MAAAAAATSPTSRSTWATMADPGRSSGRCCASCSAEFDGGQPAAAAGAARSRWTRPPTAFRFMAQAQHIGKVVLVHRRGRAADAVAVRADATLPDHRRPGRPRACWWRAGWSSAARATWCWSGRRAPGEPRGRRSARAAERAGREVDGRRRPTWRDADDVAPRAGGSPRELPPLRGIVHAAGRARRRRAGRSRAGRASSACWRRRSRGGWNLHALTRATAARLLRAVLVDGRRCWARRARATTPRPTPSSTRSPQHRRRRGPAGAAASTGARGRTAAWRPALDRRNQARIGRQGLRPHRAGRGTRPLRAAARPAPRRRSAVLPAATGQVPRPRPPGSEPPLLAELALGRVRADAAALAGGASAPRAPCVQIDAGAGRAAARASLLAHVREPRAAACSASIAAAALDSAAGRCRSSALDSLMAVELRNVFSAAWARACRATVRYRPGSTYLADVLDAGCRPSS